MLNGVVLLVVKGIHRRLFSNYMQNAYIFEFNYCVIAVALVPAIAEVQLGLGITDTVLLPAQHSTCLLGEQTLCA